MPVIRRGWPARQLLVGAVALIALTATPVIAGIPAAHATAPRAATLYSSDGRWKVRAEAFKNYLFLYSSIGTEVTTYHWERQRRWWDPWYDHHHWVERRVDAISITNRYSGLLPNLDPSAAARRASANDRSHLEEKIWAAGIGVSMDASASSGLPDPGTAGPCCGARLDVREVEGHVSVRIGNEVLTTDVSAR